MRITMTFTTTSEILQQYLIMRAIAMAMLTSAAAAMFGRMTNDTGKRLVLAL